ncbi:MAG: HipA domain-containing protein, partial [Spirochaetes bacterium]|nr:HipA domain-containing protein [Spirochaetota bacterium]
VENEWLCSRLVEALGLPIARSEITSFEDQKVLIVERFDRRLAADVSWWIRLPQEDLCQATGTPPDGKYESEGGPGIADIMKILLGSRDAFADRRTFLKAQIVFWILAASDGHAKNFSLFIEPKGRYALTPLYDVISAYPVLGHGKGQLAPEKLHMAMAVRGTNRHYEWSRAQARHWISTAASCGAQSEIESIFSELIAGVPEAINKVSAMTPAGFPASIADPIFKGIQAAAARLQGERFTRI